MTATPKYGCFTFLGLRTGQSFIKDIYRSDVDKGLINWDSGQGAGSTSETFWTAPEPVILVDVALVTGTADTEKLLLTRNGVPTGDMIRYGPHTDSVATRPKLRIVFPAGSKVAATQVAD